MDARVHEQQHQQQQPAKVSKDLFQVFMPRPRLGRHLRLADTSLLTDIQARAVEVLGAGDDCYVVGACRFFEQT
jgi:hypothetical protein